MGSLNPTGLKSTPYASYLNPVVAQEAWEELIERCEAVGVDAFEVNFSCPHGMPERRMGMAMGQDCELLAVRADRTRAYMEYM